MGDQTQAKPHGWWVGGWVGGGEVGRMGEGGRWRESKGNGGESGKGEGRGRGIGREEGWHQKGSVGREEVDLSC